MFIKIPKTLFSETVAFLDATVTRKTLLDKVNMSNQWLYMLTQNDNDHVKIKRDKWVIIKSLAIDTAVKQSDLLNQLKDY